MNKYNNYRDLEDKVSNIVLTKISMDIVECVNFLSMDKFKKEFISKMGLGKGEDENLFMYKKITDFIDLVPATIETSSRIFEECKNSFNVSLRKVDSNYKFLITAKFGSGIMKSRKRPARGGYGILDTYIMQAYKLGYVKDLNRTFNMYLIYKFINYDSDNLLNMYISYVLGYSNESSLHREAVSTKSDD